MQILVYSDEGVSGPSLRKLCKSLEQDLKKDIYTVVRKNAEEILKEDWESTTTLFIIPGGRDIEYLRKLKKEGCDKISRYVENGGKYLGICAGAYFAAGAIEFEKGGELEVCGERFLKFYPNLAVGPALGLNKYRPDSEAGAEIVEISFAGQKTFSYYNGGCYFEGPNSKDVKVLGSYQTFQPKAAVVCRKVGNGQVLLTGVHLEYALEDSREPPRRKAFREILSFFDLNLESHYS